MLRALSVIAIVTALAIVEVLAYVATRPDRFRIERQTRINAPPERVFALINDFRQWGAWSPWETMDSALKRSYSGAPGGKGAVYEWEGNNKVGSRMEILEAPPPSRVDIKLDFMKPFAAHNRAEFTLRPDEGTTHVTWAMHGPNLFIGKVMSLFFNMDRMVGKDFETGLANLKTVAERQALAGS